MSKKSLNSNFTFIFLSLLCYIAISNSLYAQPTVVRVTPETNSTEVPLYKRGMVEIVFSEAMNRQSVEDALTISNEYFLSYLFNWNAQRWLNDRTLSLPYWDSPTFGFLIDTTYTITIGTEAKSIEGINLQEEFVWSFRTVSNPFDSSKIEKRIIEIYDEEFDLKVGFPPITGSYAPYSYFTSVVYLNEHVYRIHMLQDGTYMTWQVSIGNKRPSGNIDVLVLAIDYGNTNISSVINSLWPVAQGQINQDLIDYSDLYGLDSAVVQFTNTNLLVPKSSINNPADKNNVLAYLNTLGISEDDYDVFMVLDLNATVSSGGFAAEGWNFVYMGNFYTASDTIIFDSDRLYSIADACYDHEMGHVWGWEHEWQKNDNDCDALIPSTSLLGWVDTDGDGIIEINDPTPFGGAFRIIQQPIDAEVNIHDNISISVETEGSIGLSYQWFRNADSVGLDSNVLIINNISIADTGLYYCSISSENLIKYSDTVQVSIILPNTLTRVVEPVNWMIYPNPSQEKIFLQPSNDLSSDITVSFYNNTGLLCHRVELTKLIKNQIVEIDISHLIKGLYLVQLSNSEGIKTEKVIKK